MHSVRASRGVARKIIAFTAALFLCSQAVAEDGLKISKPWVRLAPPNMKAHAAYFTLENTTGSNRFLVSVESGSYDRAELHMSRMTDGIATMSRVEQVDLAPRTSAAFEPSGLHVMLIGPKSPQVEGAKVPLMLLFRNGEKVSVDAIVKKSQPMNRKGDGAPSDQRGSGHHKGTM
ncbi:MAG: copper chaperone PCu(A)C [Methyloligellaceae bacterium]